MIKLGYYVDKTEKFPYTYIYCVWKEEGKNRLLVDEYYCEDDINSFTLSSTYGLNDNRFSNISNENLFNIDVAIIDETENATELELDWVLMTSFKEEYLKIKKELEKIKSKAIKLLKKEDIKC